VAIAPYTAVLPTESFTMHFFKRFIASALIATTTLMGLPLQAQAGMVSTEESLQSAVADAQRERVATFLAREDVRLALQSHGVGGDAASARVQAMTDAEVSQLANRMDQLPAGGDILGVLFTVFIVLLVTDILGLTKVFPFTRSVR
jgi:hypothetical protein